jgi:hypothetical protein
VRKLKKYLILAIFVISFLILSFGETLSEISFYFVFGNKVESGINAKIKYYYSDKEWAFLKIKSNFYPINIKINDQNLFLKSDDQIIVVKPGKIKITYNNNSFYYQAEAGENHISLLKNIQLEPKIKILEFRDLVSPNNDWYKDKMKIELNTNTYAKMKFVIGNQEYNREIYPGENTVYFDLDDFEDGNYESLLKIYNEKGEYKIEKDITINRSQKSYGKQLLFGIITIFAGLIICDSL